MKLCEKSEIIIDIGASTGIYSLIAKTINPKSMVYSFEPNPIFFPMLQKNILLNNFDILPYKKAISNRDGTVIIDDYCLGTSLSLTSEALTLDTFIKQNSITKIDLMKIDVETHEPQVLEGFLNYLSQFKPTIIIEVLNDDIAKKINNYVHNLDYLYFNIDEIGSIRKTDKIEKSDYYNYLLCNQDIAAKLV